MPPEPGGEGCKQSAQHCLAQGSAQPGKRGELQQPCNRCVQSARKREAPHNQQIGDVAQFTSESADVTARNNVLLQDLQHERFCRLEKYYADSEVSISVQVEMPRAKTPPDLVLSWISSHGPMPGYHEQCLASTPGTSKHHHTFGNVCAEMLLQQKQSRC